MILNLSVHGSKAKPRLQRFMVYAGTSANPVKVDKVYTGKEALFCPYNCMYPRALLVEKQQQQKNPPHTHPLTDLIIVATVLSHTIVPSAMS